MCTLTVAAGAWRSVLTSCNFLTAELKRSWQVSCSKHRRLHEQRDALNLAKKWKASRNFQHACQNVGNSVMMQCMPEQVLLL